MKYMITFDACDAWYGSLSAADQAEVARNFTPTVSERQRLETLTPAPPPAFWLEWLNRSLPDFVTDYRAGAMTLEEVLEAALNMTLALPAPVRAYVVAFLSLRLLEEPASASDGVH